MIYHVRLIQDERMPFMVDSGGSSLGFYTEDEQKAELGL